MEARRSLRDLYKVREGLEFQDPDIPDGPSVRVWVVKLNQQEMDAVERHAGAAKALVLLDRDNPESEEFLSHMAELLMLPDPNSAIPFLLVDTVRERRLSILAQHASEGRWGGDDNLYESLLDAWKGDGEDPDSGLESIYAAYPDQPEDTPESPDLSQRWKEAQRVYALLLEFQSEINELLDEELPDLEAEHRIEPDDNGNYDPEATRRLLTKVAKSFIEARALDVYWQQFARWRSYYATRQRFTEPDENGNEVPGPEMRLPYFESIADFDGCADEVKELLRQTYDSIAVPALEGKGWPAATTSSSPPDSLALVGESQPSGQQESTG